MKNKTDNTKCHHVCRAMKTLSIAGGREEWCGHPGWIVWQFLSKLNTLSIQPSNPILGCYLRVTKISHTNLQWIFIATQFIISENLEWPKCPSAGEWISKMRHVTHGGILSNPKEQTVDTCSNLDDTWGNYSERNMLPHKVTYHVMPFTWLSLREKASVTEHRSGLPEGLVRGRTWLQR